MHALGFVERSPRRQVIFGSLPWDIECVRLANLYKLRKGLAMNVLDLVTNVDLNDVREADRRKLLETCMN